MLIFVIVNFAVVMADCIYNLPKTYQPKKRCLKVFKITGEMRIALKKIFLVREFVFVWLLIFDIWSILYIVDYDV